MKRFLVVICVLFLVVCWYLLSILGGLGGMPSGCCSFNYPMRNNYKLRSTLNAPDGYVFSAYLKPYTALGDNIVGLEMKKRRASLSMSNLGIYNYSSGEYLYNYKFPVVVRNRAGTVRLTREVIYTPFIDKTYSEDEPRKPNTNKLCWDLHNMIDGSDKTVCVEDSIDPNRRKYKDVTITPDAKYVMYQLRNLDRRWQDDLYIIHADTGNLAANIDNVADFHYNSKPDFWGSNTYIFRHKAKKNSETENQWYVLSGVNYTLIESDYSYKSNIREKFEFKTKDFYAFRDFSENRSCAAEISSGHDAIRKVICKESLFPRDEAVKKWRSRLPVYGKS